MGNLDLIVQMHNNVETILLPVERPLLQQQLVSTEERTLQFWDPPLEKIYYRAMYSICIFYAKTKHNCHVQKKAKKYFENIFHFFFFFVVHRKGECILILAPKTICSARTGNLFHDIRLGNALHIL